MNKTETTYDLQEHIMRLVRMMRRHPAGGAGHISHSGLQLLKVILMEDGIRTSELAQRLDIRPSSLTDLLKRMEENGDISRERDAQDSRVQRIRATDKAREAFAERQVQRARQAERLAACLSEEESAAFCATCDKLSAFLEAEYGGEAHRHRGCGHHGGRGRPGGHEGHGRGGRQEREAAGPEGEGTYL